MAKNTTIDTFLDRDDELYNVIIARGPGDGLNRVTTIVEDAPSIASYGRRETIVDFIDITDLTDLQTKAQEYLDAHKNPQQELEVTHLYKHDSPPNFQRGDTIRIADQSLGLAVTTKIQELQWSFDEVQLTLGTPAYNLIDELINEPEQEEKDKVALGLPIPLGFKAQKAFPGIHIQLNPYQQSRAVGVEIHASITSGFTPDNGTLLVRSAGTRFQFPELTSGVQYFFKARSYDSQGKYSDFTEQVTAVAGFFDGGRIEDGTIGITPIASSLRPPRNVLSLPDTDLTTDYLLGDLVAYDDGSGARLYKLTSETGDPNTDWTLMTAAALESETVAHQIVAGQIVAGAVTADEIAANAITAVKIDAGAVTADKIAVDGPINVTDSTYGTGYLSVKDAGNDEKIRIGNISNLPGVPPSVDYGLWGELGSGVFIQGSAKLAYSTNTEMPDTIHGVSGGTVIPVYKQAQYTVTGLSIPVLEGQKVLFSTFGYDAISGFLTTDTAGTVLADARDGDWIFDGIYGIVHAANGNGGSRFTVTTDTTITSVQLTVAHKIAVYSGTARYLRVGPNVRWGIITYY